MKKNKILFLGLFIFSVAQLVCHYFKLSDLFRGLVLGVPTGLLFLHLLQSKSFNKVQ